MTTTTTHDVPPGYWRDANDNLVPVTKVKEIDKVRDKLVRSVIAEAKKHSGLLQSFKLGAMAEIAEFVQVSADQYGAKLRGVGGKGNLTLLSFDGRYKIVRATAESIAFDERLQVAKTLIDDCIHVWSKGANKNLQALVSQAFETDAAGKVSASRVLALRRLQIDDEKWQQAMQAIADGMRVSASKSYLRFYERNDQTGEYMPISLDMAVL